MKPLLEAAPLPDLPSTQPRVGHYCRGPECENPVIAFRNFCDECFADAAKDLARQLETELICRLGLQPEEARRALDFAPAMHPLEWYETVSVLGKLTTSEALYLRALTQRACKLVVEGGVAALANLPGTRRGCHLVTKGKCDFSALPQHDETEPQPAPWRAEVLVMERRYQAYYAAVLAVALLLLLAVPR